MTPEQLATIATDAQVLAPQMPAVAAAFYRALFDQRPDLEARFQPGRVDRESVFAHRLPALLGALDDVETLVERSAALGEHHARHGVRSSDYAAAGEALLAAVEQVLGDPMVPAQVEAWRQAIRLITESMLQGARPRSTVRRAREYASPW